MTKMRRPHFTRCSAPQGSRGGYHQCVHTRPCPDHPEARWRLLRVPLALVWAVRPWWPSHLGRAQDRGHAHTPNIYPCKACRLEQRIPAVWTPEDATATSYRHQRSDYVPGYEPRRSR